MLTNKMSYKIGIFGSSDNLTLEAQAKVDELAEALSDKELTLLTGAGAGLPYQIASKAHKNGSKIWGFSPAISLEEHKSIYPQHDPSIYEKLIFVPKDYEFAKDKLICKKYRNVTSTAICDAGIIISGRWGTLNEFTNLYDMGKVIGVLQGTGDIADELKGLYDKIKRKGDAVVLFDNSPGELVKKVITTLDQRKL